MSDSTDPISAEEARATLSSINQMKSQAVASVTPPLWYVVISSVLYGIATYSYAMMDHKNLWVLGLIVSIVLFILLFAILDFSYRLLGMKLNVFPKSTSGKLFMLVQAFFFGGVFIAARMLTEAGFEWVALLGGIINGAAFGYIVYQFPTGEISRPADLPSQATETCDNTKPNGINEVSDK